MKKQTIYFIVQHSLLVKLFKYYLDESDTVLDLTVTQYNSLYTINYDSNVSLDGVLDLTFKVWDKFHIYNPNSISIKIYSVSF